MEVVVVVLTKVENDDIFTAAFKDKETAIKAVLKDFTDSQQHLFANKSRFASVINEMKRRLESMNRYSYYDTIYQIDIKSVVE